MLQRRFRHLLGYSRAEVTVIPVDNTGCFKVRFSLGVRNCAILLTEEQLRYPLRKLQETHLTQVVDLFHQAGVPDRTGLPMI